MSESVSTPMKTNVQAYGFEEVMDIHFTKDLSIFSVIEGNRPPNPRHIKNIIKSIKEFGMLRRVILVNESYEVIDGQHRLEAAKKEGVGVYYIILEGYALNEVHILNLNQKNWTQKDFLDGYADMGILDYRTLRSLAKENSDFHLSDVRVMCSNKYELEKLDNSEGVSISTRAFKEGRWQLLNLERAEEYMENIRKIKPYYEGYNRNVFVLAMIDLFNNPDFEFKLFLKKLKLQPRALADCSRVPQYKAMIEDIYNFKNHNKVNLRF